MSFHLVSDSSDGGLADLFVGDPLSLLVSLLLDVVLDLYIDVVKHTNLGHDVFDVVGEFENTLHADFVLEVLVPEEFPVVEGVVVEGQLHRLSGDAHGLRRTRLPGGLVEPVVVPGGLVEYVVPGGLVESVVGGFGGQVAGAEVSVVHGRVLYPLLAQELVVHLVLELLRVEHVVREVGLAVWHVGLLMVVVVEVVFTLGGYIKLLLPRGGVWEGQHRLAGDLRGRK